MMNVTWVAILWIVFCLTVLALTDEFDAEVNTDTEQVEEEDNTSVKKVKRIFYINLNESEKRREHMEKMLSRRTPRIPVERVVPVSMSEVSKVIQRRHHGQNVTGQRKFCHFDEYNKERSFDSMPGGTSSYLTWERLVDRIVHGDIRGASPGDIVFICEDDILFESDWKEIFGTALPRLQRDAPNWHIARIGWWGNQREEDAINKYWFKVTHPIYWSSWPPVYWYHGVLAVMLRVGNASQPLANLFHREKICWVETIVTHKSIDSYVINLRRMIAKHGDFKSVRRSNDRGTTV